MMITAIACAGAAAALASAVAAKNFATVVSGQRLNENGEDIPPEEKQARKIDAAINGVSKRCGWWYKTDGGKYKFCEGALHDKIVGRPSDFVHGLLSGYELMQGERYLAAETDIPKPLKSLMEALGMDSCDPASVEEYRRLRKVYAETGEVRLAACGKN